MHQYNQIKVIGRVAVKAARSMKNVISDQELLFTFGTLEKEFIDDNPDLLEKTKQIPLIKYKKDSQSKKEPSKSSNKQQKLSPKASNINVSRLSKREGAASTSTRRLNF